MLQQDTDTSLGVSSAHFGLFDFNKLYIGTTIIKRFRFRPIIYSEFKDLEDAMVNPDSPQRQEYEKIRKQNLHKMDPIPVCKIPS